MKHRNTPYTMFISTLLALTMGVSTVCAEEASPTDSEEETGQSEIIEPVSQPETEDEPAVEEVLEEDVSVSEEEHTESDAAVEIPENDSEEEKNEEEVTETVSQPEEKSPRFAVPDGFEPSETDLTLRRNCLEYDVKGQLEESTEGIDYEPGTLIVLTEDEAYAETAAEIYHGELSCLRDGVGEITLTDPEITVKDAVLACLEDERLPFVEPDYLSEIEPDIEYEEGTESLESLPKARDWSGWVEEAFKDPDTYLKDPTNSSFQWYHDMIGTYAAWNVTTGSDKVKVGVIDCGTNDLHYELRHNTTMVDMGDVRHYGSGHGTEVAGYIGAAADNGSGGAGIAPDVQIVAMDVFLGKTTYKRSNLIRGLNRAMQENCDIVNMSLSAKKYSAEEEQVIKTLYSKGITMVCSASNNGTNIRVFPATFKETICVAAVDRNGRRAPFSNYGKDVDISAPGVQMWSCWSSDNKPYNNYYNWMNGTSASTPLVSGALALYMSVHGHVSPEECRSVLKKSAVPCPDEGMGAGILNMENMFDNEKQEVKIQVFNKEDQPITSFEKSLPQGAYIMITPVKEKLNSTILFSTDGKKPVIRNKEVIHGEIFEKDTFLYADTLPKGSTVTLNAAAVSGLGVLGKNSSITIHTYAPEPAKVKIGSLTLKNQKLSLKFSANAGIIGSDRIQIGTLKDVKGNPVDLSAVEHEWISSDPKTVEVTSDGTVQAKAAGTARVTLRLLDGSKKSAVCTVTAVQLAESVTISGQDGVAQGASALMKASVLPSSTKNRSVTWSLREEVKGISITKNGTLKVGKSVPAGTEFTVVATASDGSAIYGEKTVRVDGKATSLVLLSEDPRAVRNKKGDITSITIFTKNIPNSPVYNGKHNQTQLTAQITGNEIPPVWTSSNPKVATVDDNGLVTAVGKGTARITCTANDGSRKKDTVTVNVHVPVSFIKFGGAEKLSLSIGKSMNLNKLVNYGSTYGKPSEKKAEFILQDVTFTDINKKSTSILEKVNELKAVTLKNGVLSLNKKILEAAEFDKGFVQAKIKAVSADGTGYDAETTVWLAKPLSVWAFGNSESKPFEPFTEITVDSSKKLSLFVDTPARVEVKTSDRDLLGVYLDYNAAAPMSYSDPDHKDMMHYGMCYPVWIYTYPNKTGKAVITFYSPDGKSKKYTIYVR